MSGFQVGDVVVCVDDRLCPITKVATSYVKGRVYRVAHVRSGLDNIGRACTGLKAVGLEHEMHRNVVCFRHVQTASKKFTASIRACKPRVGEPA